MAPTGIGIDLFVGHMSIEKLNHVVQAAQRTPYGMLCALATGSPQNSRVVARWDGIPDVVDAADMVPPPADTALTEAIGQTAHSLALVMWNTGQTLLMVDADGWGIAFVNDQAAWAAPPWRILPSLGMVFAPSLYTSAHARLAQQDVLTRVGPRLEAFSRTTQRILGTAPPPLIIDPTICTI